MTNEAQEASSEHELEQNVQLLYGEKYPLLDFKPHEDVRAAVYSARRILAKRNTEESLKLAKALVQMKKIIDKIERDAAFKTINQNGHVDTVWLSEGRALMLWADSFDLSSLNLRSLKLFELFAVKTLMLCADFTRIKALSVDHGKSDFERSLVLRSQFMADNTILSDIIDCIARAEVAQQLSSNSSAAKMLGSKGGKGRTNKLLPLITACLKLYIEKFQTLPVLTAANSIEAILRAERPDLLALSTATKKEKVIQNWIREFKQGKLKISVSV